MNFQHIKSQRNFFHFCFSFLCKTLPQIFFLLENIWVNNFIKHEVRCLYWKLSFFSSSPNKFHCFSALYLVWLKFVIFFCFLWDCLWFSPGLLRPEVNWRAACLFGEVLPVYILYCVFLPKFKTPFWVIVPRRSINNTLALHANSVFVYSLLRPIFWVSSKDCISQFWTKFWQVRVLNTQLNICHIYILYFYDTTHPIRTPLKGWNFEFKDLPYVLIIFHLCFKLFLMIKF